MSYSNIVKLGSTNDSTPQTQRGTGAPPDRSYAAVAALGRKCNINPPSQQHVVKSGADTLPKETPSLPDFKRHQWAGDQRGAVRKQKMPPTPRTGGDISEPLQEMLKPMGYVKGQFSSTQKKQFALAREKCEELQKKLLQADKGQASEALKQLYGYALIAGKGMDYQSSVQLLNYLLSDYLPRCSDKHLTESAEKTVGLILDRLVYPLFVRSDFKNDENCELARKQVLDLCQKKNFKPLTLMEPKSKESLMSKLIKKIIKSKRYDQLSGLFKTFAYEELVQRSLTEKVSPVAPWCARLYWLAAVHYTHKLPIDQLKAKFDRIEEEIKPFVNQYKDIKRVYLNIRCDLSCMYEPPRTENAMDQINQLIAELESCPRDVIQSSRYKESMLATVWQSKVKMLLDEDQLEEAGDLLEKVFETEKKHGLSSLKKEALKTRLKRLTIGNQPKSLEDIEMIQQEIARLKKFGDKYHVFRFEKVECLLLLNDKWAALKELEHYAGSKPEVLIRIAILLSDIKRYSESVETIRRLPYSGYSQKWKALTTDAITLTNWARDGYEINRDKVKSRLAEGDRKNYFLESLKLFKEAIECGPDSYSGGWGGIGHLCDILSKDGQLDFRQCKDLLPEGIQQATSWRDAARKAFGIEKGQTPKETARIQSRLKQTIPGELYSTAAKQPVTNKVSGLPLK